MHIKRGLLVMLCASALFALMQSAIRKLHVDAPHTSSFLIAAVRFGLGNLFVLVAFAVGWSRPRWVNRRWIILRGVMGGIGIITHFWAIKEFGLAKGALFAATFTVFAALFAVPILGERLRPGHWIAIGVAMVGMILMKDVSGFAFRLKDLLGFSIGITWGLAVVSVTKCRETDDSINIFWSQCLFGVAFAVGPPVCGWVPWVAPNGYEWAMLLLIASLSIAGQLCMTSAYKYTGATYGSLIGLLSPVLATIIAVFAFKEQPSVRFWLGGVMILLPCVYLSLNPVHRRSTDGAEGAE